MKTTYTECVIAQNGCDPISGDSRIIIRIADQGAGPYLQICGYHGEPIEGETASDIFLESDDEIDRFAEVCKAMLKQAGETK